ncbi:hypothetical protein LJB88_00965 [Erysipelotrichaceae bacterium OttesenSCG-928-M19]|nr:hypothetical protein [Erysipelotrichaceae bacterium OttesenSCG-928-M19]
MEIKLDKKVIKQIKRNNKQKAIKLCMDIHKVDYDSALALVTEYKLNFKEVDPLEVDYNPKAKPKMSKQDKSLMIIFYLFSVIFMILLLFLAYFIVRI